MKIILALLLVIFPALLPAQPIDKDLAAIRQVMNLQQEAWNRADLNAFMDGYWKSDSLMFVGRNGITYGWQTTLDNYKKTYPTPEAMGKLTFTLVTLEKQSSGSAFLIGKWHLKRVNDELGGYFTLLWKKINGKWVIVTDHTS